jgi:hypothetical protein
LNEDSIEKNLRLDHISQERWKCCDGLVMSAQANIIEEATLYQQLASVELSPALILQKKERSSREWE